MPSVLEHRSVLTEGDQGRCPLETRTTPPGGTPMQGTEQTLAGLKKILS
jgi:hypothetical protein